MLIGLAGKAGAGKDTVADYLVEKYGFVKLSFAGPLKAMLAASGFAEPADRAVKELVIEGFDFSWRQAAQTLGTEWGRALDPDIWIKCTRRLVVDELAKGKSVVFSDVRFENEAQMVRDLSGQVWQVVGRKVDLGTSAGHSSEHGLMFLDHKDVVVDNSESLGALYHTIDDMAWEFN